MQRVRQAGASGAVSGCSAKIITAPLERIKLLYQVSPTKEFSFGSATSTAFSIMRQRGVLALWRGAAAGLLRDSSYAATFFSGVVLYERACRDAFEFSGVTRHLLAASAAGATATLVTYPLDVLRTRLAADTTHLTSQVQTARQLVLSRGKCQLFLGLRPALLGIIPYSSISYAIFEECKQEMRRSSRYETDAPLSASQRLGAGAIAGMVAQVCTYPLNVVRRRMQVGGVLNEANGEGVSVWRALVAIYRREGVSNGLFKGLRLSLCVVPLQTAVGFTVNDLVRQYLRQSEQEARPPLASPTC